MAWHGMENTGKERRDHPLTLFPVLYLLLSLLCSPRVFVLCVFAGIMCASLLPPPSSLPLPRLDFRSPGYTLFPCFPGGDD